MRRLLCLLCIAAAPAVSCASPPTSAMSALATAPSLAERVTSIARSLLHVREATNHNDGPDVEAMLREIGLPKGSSWCMAFVGHCYRVAGFAWPKMGRCAAVWDLAKRRELTYVVIGADEMALRGLKPGDVPIWKTERKTGKDWNGHTGIVEAPGGGGTFQTIEGNTSPGAKGSQSDGGGVYRRVRRLGLGTLFAVQGFIRVRGA